MHLVIFGQDRVRLWLVLGMFTSHVLFFYGFLLRTPPLGPRKASQEKLAGGTITLASHRHAKTRKNATNSSMYLSVLVPTSTRHTSLNNQSLAGLDLFWSISILDRVQNSACSSSTGTTSTPPRNNHCTQLVRSEVLQCDAIHRRLSINE